MRTSEIEPATFRFVKLHLNQLRHRVPLLREGHLLYFTLRLGMKFHDQLF